MVAEEALDDWFDAVLVENGLELRAHLGSSGYQVFFEDVFCEVEQAVRGGDTSG